MNYRRKWGTHVWHSSPACSEWPQSAMDAEEREEKPSHGDLCPECEAYRQLPGHGRHALDKRT